MNTLEAIANRRSIRRYKSDPVPREVIEQILKSACQSPSGKNRQPWRFVVLQGSKKDELVRIMADAVNQRKEDGIDTGSAEWSAKSMSQAPVCVLVFDGEAQHNIAPWEPGNHNIVDIQSIGGAIQTMLLAAEELGFGTLWICDVFYAYYEIRDWLHRSDQLIAAVSIGYADESPGARPRNELNAVTEWLL